MAVMLSALLAGRPLPLRKSTSSGLELATFWLESDCLNQQRYRVPPFLLNMNSKSRTINLIKRQEGIGVVIYCVVCVSHFYPEDVGNIYLRNLVNIYQNILSCNTSGSQNVKVSCNAISGNENVIVIGYKIIYDNDKEYLIDKYNLCEPCIIFVCQTQELINLSRC
jgi:hypothetical protein